MYFRCWPPSSDPDEKHRRAGQRRKHQNGNQIGVEAQERDAGSESDDRGRRIEAAQLLGIGRNTITRKIQELGLDTPRDEKDSHLGV